MLSEPLPQECTVLAEDNWHALRTAHEAKIRPFIEAFQHRRLRHKKHPVHDFLFDYYQCNRKHLLEWKPGWGVGLEGESARIFLKDNKYALGGNLVGLSSERIPEKTATRVAWVLNLLRSAIGRESNFGCFGMHEWAMLYKNTDRRHPETPLRVNQEAIDHAVETCTIRCTHYDAFRFFTPEAKPLNARQLTHESRESNDQFGCLHFNMDLYKWSYKLAPYVGSDLILRAFELAIKAREMDMRASPYDVSEYGLEPVDILSNEGKMTYKAFQKEIDQQGRTIAKELIDRLEAFVHFC